MLRTSLNNAHSLRVGQLVNIFRFQSYGPPLFEGRAEVVALIQHTPHLYDVRFLGERRVSRRFAHAGAWQSDSQATLMALTDLWRAAVAPEHTTFTPPTICSARKAQEGGRQ